MIQSNFAYRHRLGWLEGSFQAMRWACRIRTPALDRSKERPPTVARRRGCRTSRGAASWLLAGARRRSASCPASRGRTGARWSARSQRCCEPGNPPSDRLSTRTRLRTDRLSRGDRRRIWQFVLSLTEPRIGRAVTRSTSPPPRFLLFGRACAPRGVSRNDDDDAQPRRAVVSRIATTKTRVYSPPSPRHDDHTGRRRVYSPSSSRHDHTGPPSQRDVSRSTSLSSRRARTRACARVRRARRGVTSPCALTVV